MSRAATSPCTFVEFGLPNDIYGMPDKRTPRFICRGGKGQAGEPGGLRKYVTPEGVAGIAGKVAPILAEAVGSSLGSTIFRYRQSEAFCLAWRG